MGLVDSLNGGSVLVVAGDPLVWIDLKRMEVSFLAGPLLAKELPELLV